MFLSKKSPLWAIALLLAITACSDGSGGGDGVGGDGVGVGVGDGLATGEFSKNLADNTPDDISGFFAADLYVRYQFFYPASDIEASGNITSLKLSYFADELAAIDCPNVNIRMGHTTLTALTNTFASNIEQGAGSLETVLDNGAITFPPGSPGDQHEIALATPFNYNGVDNLVVEFERTSACDGTFNDARESGTGNNVVWTFTPGDPTGTNSTWRNSVELVFTGGDNSVLYSGIGGNIIPFGPTVGFQHVQQLHLASDINGSGPITGIAMISGATTGTASYTVNVKLGHTSLSALTNTFADNFDLGNPLIVAAALTFSIPAGVPGDTPIWLPITESFDYNGTDNLIVDIEVLTDSGAETSWKYDSLVANRRLFAPVGNITGGVAAGAYDTVFRFNGAPVSVITDGSTATGNVFPEINGNGRLSLYRASELGTAGTIDSVACRIDGASTATSYVNYQVIIGHSNIDSLSPTAADNFVSQTVAVNGTITVAAGLLQGDWIEVPLSTPFAYDGKSNLAIWMGTDTEGTSRNGCVGSADKLTRFLGQTAGGVPGDTTVVVQDYKLDMKLDISK